jgi:hypothetical protein
MHINIGWETSQTIFETETGGVSSSFTRGTLTTSQGPMQTTDIKQKASYYISKCP